MSERVVVPVFEPTNACEICEGGCCKTMGCHFSPLDFQDLSFEALKTEIEKGHISIDWWDGYDGVQEYYLRMRHKGGPVVDPSWGGECVLLTDRGCPLPFEKRPLGARALRPNDYNPGKCVTFYSKEDCKNDWLLYDNILRDLVDYFEE